MYHTASSLIRFHLSPLPLSFPVIPFAHSPFPSPDLFCPCQKLLYQSPSLVHPHNFMPPNKIYRWNCWDVTFWLLWHRGLVRQKQIFHLTEKQLILLHVVRIFIHFFILFNRSGCFYSTAFVYETTWQSVWLAYVLTDKRLLKLGPFLLS